MQKKKISSESCKLRKYDKAYFMNKINAPKFNEFS